MYKLVSSAEYVKKPLVAFLAGPPGAGKSRLAEDLAKAVCPNHWYRDVFASIDQGMAYTHLFGAEQGFIGSDKPPAIATFMRAHHNKRAVVILEEFEKLDVAALKGLLVPFETGEWPVHSGYDGKQPPHVNCSKFIFLLTSNLRNSDIIEWCSKSKVMEVIRCFIFLLIFFRSTATPNSVLTNEK